MPSSYDTDSSHTSPEPYQSAQIPLDRRIAADDLSGSEEDLSDQLDDTSILPAYVPRHKRPSYWMHSDIDDIPIEEQQRNLFLFNDTATPISPMEKKAHRDFVSSLEKVVSRDLSVHLYNAFKMKSKVLHHSGADRSHEASDTVTQFPSKSWTAWPLAPSCVPRVEEEDGRWEENNALPYPYLPNTGFPGQTMKEILTALVLRRAKQRIQDRSSEGQDQISAILRDREMLTAGRAVMTDDQIAMDILHPTLHHATSKFDGLLRGLHNARSSYLSRGSRINSRQSLLDRRTYSRPNSRIKSCGRSGRGTATPGRESSDFQPNEPASTDIGVSSPGPIKKRNQSSSHPEVSQKFNRNKRRLGLRNWSDVLGVASLARFEKATIERVTARCSAIFGETLPFTTSEAATGHGPARYLNSEILSSSLSQAMSEGELHDGVHVDGFLQPIQGKKSWRSQNRKGKGVALSQR